MVTLALILALAILSQGWVQIPCTDTKARNERHRTVETRPLVALEVPGGTFNTLVVKVYLGYLELARARERHSRNKPIHVFSWTNVLLNR